VKTFNSKHRFNSKQPGSTPIVSANTEGIMKKCKGKSILLAAAATVASILGAAAAPAYAITPSYTLQDQNSSVIVNPSSQSGVSNWTVDNVNQLNQEWFWYGTGSNGPQASLDTVPLSTTSPPILLDTNGDGTNNYLSTTYLSPGASGFKVVVTYNLTGGQTGSHASDLDESIAITNTGTSTLHYQFYEYTNFTLGGVASPQTATITGGNGSTIAGNTATQSGDFMVSQTVVSPRPSYSQVGSASVSPTLLSDLQTDTNLQAGGHLNNADETISNTDAAWAFEWDITLAPGATYTIGVDKDLRQVPEPTATVALFGLGGLFLTRPRRRDEDPDPRTAQVAEA
jgi:hypothetical protein